MRVGLLLCIAFGLASGQQEGDKDVRRLIQEGNQALEGNQLHAAAEAFQKAVDINPSSAKAHEGLGVALSRDVIAENVRPSEDSDTVERAENHLRQAAELGPSAVRPLIQLSELEMALAEQAIDRNVRASRYEKAQEPLRRAIGLESNRADLYLRLATVERDQFGPAIQKAKDQSGKGRGPIADVELRRTAATVRWIH